MPKSSRKRFDLERPSQWISIVSAVIGIIIGLAALIIAIQQKNDHAQIDRLSTIVDRLSYTDSLLLKSNQHQEILLGDFDSSISNLTDINRKEQNILLSQQEQINVLNNLYRRVSTPSVVIAVEDYNREKNAFDKLKSTQEKVMKKLGPYVSEDSLSAIKILNLALKELHSQDSNYAFKIDSRMKNNWEMAENLVFSAVATITHKWGNSSDRSSQDWLILKQNADMLGQLPTNINNYFFYINTQISQRLLIDKPFGGTTPNDNGLHPVNENDQ